MMNLFFFREPAADTSLKFSSLDVLIPARNEASNIEAVITSVLASSGVTLNVYVYNDDSTDTTAQIVQRLAAVDERVRLLEGIPLPQGWNGKQHACWQLAQASAAPLMLFLDADVRVEPCAIARCLAQQEKSRVPLLSGFPRVVMVTWMEWLVLPLIQFVLLGLLPMFRMRQTTKPPYAAGCGQFMLAERSAYFACGGHAAIRRTRHDGLRLPHLFRAHKLKTDICDLTHLAHVRMYSSAIDVWNGLAKNATEGLGSPGRIVPITFLLLFGQVLPTALVVYAAACSRTFAWLARSASTGHLKASSIFALFAGSVMSGYCLRLVSAWRFRQPFSSALLHPVAVLLLLSLQWYALVRQMLGRPVGWRARSYSTSSGGQVD